MIIGKLRNRIDIQTKGSSDPFTDTSDATWTTDQSRYCQITELNGKELETQKQINAKISLKITFRYFQVLPNQRLKLADRIFNILSVISDERHTMTFVYCDEVVL